MKKLVLCFLGGLLFLLGVSHIVTAEVPDDAFSNDDFLSPIKHILEASNGINYIYTKVDRLKYLYRH